MNEYIWFILQLLDCTGESIHITHYHNNTVTVIQAPQSILMAEHIADIHPQLILNGKPLGAVHRWECLSMDEEILSIVVDQVDYWGDGYVEINTPLLSNGFE